MQEWRFSENFGELDDDEKDGSDWRRRRTAGLRLYLILACTRSSLKTRIMFTLSFAEHSINPLSQSHLTIDSTTSFVTCRWSDGKSILFATTTIGTLGPRFSIICAEENEGRLASSSSRWNNYLIAYLLSKAHHFTPRLLAVDAEYQNECVWSADWKVSHGGKAESTACV